jgi:hypothetical protein
LYVNELAVTTRIEAGPDGASRWIAKVDHAEVADCGPRRDSPANRDLPHAAAPGISAGTKIGDGLDWRSETLKCVLLSDSAIRLRLHGIVWWLGILKVIVGVVVGLPLLVYAFQDRLLFFPQPLDERARAEVKARHASVR